MKRRSKEDRIDTHSALGHEFQDQSVSGVLCPENHFIDNILVEDRPLLGLRVSEDLPEHGRFAGIGEVRIEDVLAELEEGRKERVSEFLGSLAPSVGLLGEEAPDLVGGQGVQLAVAELGFKLGKKKVVIPGGIFFSVGFLILEEALNGHGYVHDKTSLNRVCGWAQL